MTKDDVTEFSSDSVVTATMHLALETGEAYMGPLHIGYFTDGGELFVAQEGKQVQVPLDCLDAFIKQLKRARTLYGGAQRLAA